MFSRFHHLERASQMIGVSIYLQQRKLSIWELIRGTTG